VPLPAPHELGNEEAIRTAVINKRWCLDWSDIARSFQRPMEEGVKLFDAIQDIYLSPEVTIAWQYTSTLTALGVRGVGWLEQVSPAQ